MAETFKRLVARDVGTSAVLVGGYRVPTTPPGAIAIVIGMTVANKLSNQSCSATVQHNDGTNSTLLAAPVTLAAGETFAPAGEMNKLVLQGNDGLFVTASSAAGLDVIVSVLEVTP